MALDTVYRLRVEALGNAFKLYLNDDLLIQQNDDLVARGAAHPEGIDQVRELMTLLDSLLSALEQVREDRLALAEHLKTKSSTACSRSCD